MNIASLYNTFRRIQLILFFLLFLDSTEKKKKKFIEEEEILKYLRKVILQFATPILLGEVH